VEGTTNVPLPLPLPLALAVILSVVGVIGVDVAVGVPAVDEKDDELFV
jgi:hypothetical protein